MMEITLEEIFQMNRIKFNTTFEKVSTLANGSFGTVIKAREKGTNRDVAVKIISKEKSISSAMVQLKREVTVLQKAEHPNIVKLYDFFETDNEIYIVMEYIKSGTLKEYIERNKGNITEKQAHEIIFYLLQSVEYLHKLNICHRDIKPENIMFNDFDDFSSLKLIDFGFSTQLERKDENEFCGTIKYMAPEQLMGECYNKNIDLWSVGIIMYILLNQGKHPFYIKGDTPCRYLEKCRSDKIKMMNHVSKEAKSLLGHLIEINPNLRYTASFALQHRWFRGFDILNLNKDEKSIEIGEIKEKSINILLAVTFLNYFRSDNKIQLKHTCSNTFEKEPAINSSNNSTEDEGNSSKKLVENIKNFPNQHSNLFLHSKNNFGLKLTLKNEKTHARMKTNIHKRNTPLLTLNLKEDQLPVQNVEHMNTDTPKNDSPSNSGKLKLAFDNNKALKARLVSSSPYLKKTKTIRGNKEKLKTLFFKDKFTPTMQNSLTNDRISTKSKTTLLQKTDKEIVTKYLLLKSQYNVSSAFNNNKNYNLSKKTIICKSTKNNDKKHFVLPIIGKETRHQRKSSINKSII